MKGLVFHVLVCLVVGLKGGIARDAGLSVEQFKKLL